MDTSIAKQQINYIIDHLPDEKLAEVLIYLRQFENQFSPKSKRAEHLRQIIQEDRHVLERLAK